MAGTDVVGDLHRDSSYRTLLASSQAFGIPPKLKTAVYPLKINAEEDTQAIRGGCVVTKLGLGRSQ